jgi:uncharacterized glyoxalase superfamily protein PhnB
MRVEPYLMFSGRCEEAMAFYQSDFLVRCPKAAVYSCPWIKPSGHPVSA